MGINAKGNIQGVVASIQALSSNIAGALGLTGRVDTGGAKPDEYDGVYEVTPTAEVQVLDTKEKLLKDNVVVAAIPKEYGLVTYNQDKTITIT